MSLQLCNHPYASSWSHSSLFLCWRSHISSLWSFTASFGSKHQWDVLEFSHYWYQLPKRWNWEVLIDSEQRNLTEDKRTNSKDQAALSRIRGANQDTQEVAMSDGSFQVFHRLTGGFMLWFSFQSTFSVGLIVSWHFLKVATILITTIYFFESSKNLFLFRFNPAFSSWVHSLLYMVFL